MSYYLTLFLLLHLINLRCQNYIHLLKTCKETQYVHVLFLIKDILADIISFHFLNFNDFLIWKLER